MKKVLSLFLLTLILGCSDSDNSTNEPAVEFVRGTEGTVLSVTLRSKEVVKGKIDETEYQNFNIYLPPSYYHNNINYPVIYFLHGFGESNTYATSQHKLMDSLILIEGSREFIVVEPNGESDPGGSFYTNSPATGNWEDYITKEIVNHIDMNYRTIADKSGRGIAGFSMGGTGTINIGFKHPDKFNALYAFSAGVLKDGDLETMTDLWGHSRIYFNSYGAASSPNLDLDAPYAEIPNETYDDPAENNRVINNWYNLFGNHDEKLDLYLSKNQPLSGICITSNSDDYYSWIPNGNIDLHRILTEKGIEHEYELGNEGGHSLPEDFTVNNLFPFFSKHL